MRETYGRRISAGLLKQIEERNIVFIEDGADIQQILTEQQSKEDMLVKIKEPREGLDLIRRKEKPQKAVININMYIAKYDFEIARKVKGSKVEILSYIEKQRLFHRLAMLELLYDISKILKGDPSYFNRMSLIDGTHLEQDITSIPQDCRLIIVSQVPEFNQGTISFKDHFAFKGLKGNIYDIKDERDAQKLKILRQKESMNRQIDKWFVQSLQKWNENTPCIETGNKLEDLDHQFHGLQRGREALLSTEVLPIEQASPLIT